MNQKYFVQKICIKKIYKLREVTGYMLTASET